MAIITSGTTFATGDQVTASTLNTQWTGAAFASGAVDSSTTQLSSGAIIVKDGGITSAKLASSVQATTQLSSLGTIVATPSDATALVGANSQTPRFQVNGTDTANFGAFLFNVTDSTFPALYLTKSGNATIGSHTVVATNEALGGIIGCGSDGTNYQTAGQIKFEVDHAVAAGYVPGRIVLRTAGWAGTLADALTLDSSQNATFKGNITSSYSAGTLDFSGTSGTVSASVGSLNLSVTTGNTISASINAVQRLLVATAGVTVTGTHTVSSTVIHTLSATPASAAAAGTVGTISWDASYIYICTATNTWKRVAIATW